MSNNKNGKVLAFDSYCKKIMRNETRSFYRELERQQARVLFSELSQNDLKQLYTYDTYFAPTRLFSVFEYKIVIQNDVLADAVSLLSEQQKNIILLAYFVGMTDRQIGEKLLLIRATVQYKRNSALRKLRQYIGDNDCEIWSP